MKTLGCSLMFVITYTANVLSLVGSGLIARDASSFRSGFMRCVYLLGVLFLTCHLSAQNDSIFPYLKYKTFVKPYEINTRQVLFGLKDTSVIISNTGRKSHYNSGSYSLKEMGIRDITEIVYEKRGKSPAMGIGALTGAALGIGIAFAYGESQADKMTSEEFASGGFLLTMLPVFVSTSLGIGIGAIAAGKRVTVPIHGSRKSYYLNRAMLSKVTVRQDLSWWPKDYDGNVYSAVIWRGKTWMSENLRVTHYRNGEWIPNLKATDRWIVFGDGAMCKYMNDAQTVKEQGLLYNNDAVRDPRGICPEGWHVATEEEWLTILPALEETFQDNDRLFILAGSVFALPAGYRDRSGAFSRDRSIMQWWTATPVDSSASKAAFMRDGLDGSFITDTDGKTGLSVRCVRDD